jgi:uncharacterized protein (TIGR03000 family)
MYSTVLMMALATGASTPACHHSCYGGGGYGGGCYGGYGCYGGGYGGCHGYGGCNGYSCGGGHGLFSCFRRNSCYGGCYGNGYGGHGCYGCYGGCYGGGVYAAPAGGPAPAPLPPPGQPGTKPPAGGTAPKATEGKEEVSAPTSARLLVSVPADAKLFIDDVATKSTTSSRLFVTPALVPGKDYVYTLKAEITRDGKTDTVSKQVTVRAGRTTETTIDLPVATAAK